MSFVVLHADRAATALSDDAIVPAADVPALQDAVALLARAGRTRDGATTQAEAAVDAARAAGHEAGRLEGLEAGAGEIRAELFRLAMRDGEERAQRRAEIATLALEVVRRIAADVGTPELVAAMADRATAALVPDTVATVLVAPDAVAGVRARLADRAGVTVEADDRVAADDCIVETALGRTHAGLETQLSQIDRAWREAGDGH